MEGKKFDQGKPPLDLLSTTALTEVARVLQFGAQKYDRHNWRAGMDWSRLLSAAMRHITSFNDGEDLDHETGISHLAHASCCLMFLLEYQAKHLGRDDRYKTEPAKASAYTEKDLAEEHRRLLAEKATAEAYALHFAYLMDSKPEPESEVCTICRSNHDSDESFEWEHK